MAVERDVDGARRRLHCVIHIEEVGHITQGGFLILIDLGIDQALPTPTSMHSWAAQMTDGVSPTPTDITCTWDEIMAATRSSMIWATEPRLDTTTFQQLHLGNRHFLPLINPSNGLILCYDPKNPIVFSLWHPATGILWSFPVPPDRDLQEPSSRHNSLPYEFAALGFDPETDRFIVLCGHRLGEENPVVFQERETLLEEGDGTCFTDRDCTVPHSHELDETSHLFLQSYDSKYEF